MTISFFPLCPSFIYIHYTMEGYALPAIRHSLSKPSISSPLASVRTAFAQTCRQYRHTLSPRYSTLHAKPGVNRADDSQAYPLSGYYSDILFARSQRCGQATTSPSSSQQTISNALPPKPDLPESPEEKMAIVFGTRLAGPGRSSRYDPSSNASWKTVNGVPIPPRPEEPDNCCMSGCVHCVWDDYRDEMEEWAEMLAQAKSKGSSKSKNVIPGTFPKTPTDTISTSIDDDGGGSETNWALPAKADDLFADIPVGIREFMKTEKRLKEVHRQEKSGI
ncbi:oxidoreductase-like protein [Aspergillus karnatakaensis]|uniref:oxidoreductase-like domain-containing protein n=1 Tax=Aspergillus karnatakaensis TaxID=1810916 RepID=UPI003CCE03A7